METQDQIFFQAEEAESVLLPKLFTWVRAWLWCERRKGKAREKTEDAKAKDFRLASVFGWSGAWQFEGVAFLQARQIWV